MSCKRDKFCSMARSSRDLLYSIENLVMVSLPNISILEGDTQSKTDDGNVYKNECFACVPWLSRPYFSVCGNGLLQKGFSFHLFALLLPLLQSNPCPMKHNFHTWSLWEYDSLDQVVMLHEALTRGNHPDLILQPSQSRAQTNYFSF